MTKPKLFIGGYLLIGEKEMPKYFRLQWKGGGKRKSEERSRRRRMKEEGLVRA